MTSEDIAEEHRKGFSPKVCYGQQRNKTDRRKLLTIRITTLQTAPFQGEFMYAPEQGLLPFLPFVFSHLVDGHCTAQFENSPFTSQINLNPSSVIMVQAHYYFYCGRIVEIKRGQFESGSMKKGLLSVMICAAAIIRYTLLLRSSH